MFRAQFVTAGILALCLAFEGSACRESPGPVRGALPKVQSAKALAPVWVGPAHSGSWYTPSRNGEGFALQILDRGTALVVWFTYPPPGSASPQAWILAQDGRIEGDRIIFDGAFTTRGPRFGAGFDPTALQILPWGRIEFRFDDCNRGEVSYEGPAGWGSGRREVMRLSALSELECTGKRKLRFHGARAMEGLRARSGSWYDPAHNGEGWQIEELPDGRNQVYWFTYDERGEQAWTIGVSASGGDRFEIEANLRPVGASFGESFDPASVNLVNWGKLRFDFSGCDRATAAYESSLTAFGRGSLSPIRLSKLAGTACLEQKPSVPAAGTWTADRSMPSAQSEIATATFGTRSCFAGGYITKRDFQCHDAATSAWTTLAPLPTGRDHAEAFALEGEIFVTGGNRELAPDGQDLVGLRYRFDQARWEPLPQLPAVVASGAAVLDGFAWFASLSGELHQFNPRTLQTRVIAGDGTLSRDHSQLVAFQGELWLIGGRNFLGTTHSGISIFDPASEAWRAGPSLLVRRSGFAAASSSTHVFVAGGERLSNPPVVLGTAEAIAAGDDAWNSIPSMPIAVHGVGAAVHGNAFYAYGGSRVAAVASNFGDLQVYRFGP